LQEVPFIEHFVETMSIGFRRQESEKAKKFKEYEPGCLHVDVTCLPVYLRSLDRRHGGVRKEPGVKTPFRAVEKPVVSKAEPWFVLKPEIFKQNPFIFKNKILCLQPKCDKKSIK
jgi:hypothetical protein